MDYIHENLTCPVFRIDGSVSKEDREKQLKLLNEAPQNSVLLIQVKAGGQGLNIQCASRIYFTARLGTRRPNSRLLGARIDRDKN